MLRTLNRTSISSSGPISRDSSRQGSSRRSRSSSLVTSTRRPSALTGAISKLLRPRSLVPRKVVAKSSTMSMSLNCLVWNVQGLNARTRRNVIREFVIQEKASLVCIQETKLSDVCNSYALEILGQNFDYDFLPAMNVSGGILLGWDRERWTVSDVVRGRFSISAKVSAIGPSSVPWWITIVYGPQLDHDKVQFLDELLTFRNGHQGPWFLCGDLNMIYRAQDKNNDRLDRRCMRRFWSFLNRARLEELNLVGRRYTWSNERDRPTLELLDRMFACCDWFVSFPNHVLRPLSSDCSDHCPLLLQLLALPGAKRRFRFESFWTKLPGFLDVVAAAWAPPVSNADPFRVIDVKLQKVAKALQSWSNTKVGSVRLQLAMAREVILRFDQAQDVRPLLEWELALRKSLKLRVLGLASLSRTIARQRSRLTFLAEGDANTRFYHLQAFHRSRGSRIESLRVNGLELVSDTAMADALYEHFSAILGCHFERSRRFDLHTIGIPGSDLSVLELFFTEQEVREVVMELPNDKAPGTDGFTGLFYKLSWEIIKTDIMNAFHTFWSQDSRSFSHLNDAYMLLLKKRDHPTEIKDYRPISLIHSFGKLITKCLARRLARVLDGLSGAIRALSSRGEEYMTTSGACRLLAVNCTSGDRPPFCLK